MKYHVLLNFLPLKKSNFTIPIFRKKVESEEKKWSNEIYKYRLKNSTYTYTHFWVSFSKFDGAEAINIPANENIELSKLYLHTLIFKKVKSVGINIHSMNNIFNRNKIYLILDEIKDSYGRDIGKKAIWIEPTFLKSEELFGFLIDFSFIKAKDYPFNREVQKFSLSLNADYSSNVNYNIDKYNYIVAFIKSNFLKLTELDNEIVISTLFHSIEVETLSTKKYIFNNNNTTNSQFNGVMNYGPYEFIKTKPFYFYVFKQEHRNHSRDLLKALNGVTFNTFKGLVEVFRTESQTTDNTIGIEIQNYSSEEIERIIENKIDKRENPIIISILPEKEEKFYYELKNKCLQHNIPSQSVHVETINNYNRLKWSIGSIALQIFSKLGGIPWVVMPSHKDCLIVGVGQANRFNEKIKKIERFFSYSVLVDSSGKFIEIRQLSDEIEKHLFLDKLADSISKIVEQYKTYKKIVFHIPQKIKKESIDVIKNKLEAVDSKIELSIIKINDDCIYTGYNNSENSLVPYESSFVKLSSSEYLLWTEGLNYQNKKVVKRYGNPLHVTFFYSNRSNDFKNHTAYLQDILNLSGANYRGFNAKSLPVSIYYPKLIADFTKHFKDLNLVLTTKNTEKPWFL